MMGHEKMRMGMEDQKEVSPKDMKEVKMLHDKLMGLSDKYGMSMDDLIEKCCGEMEEEDGMEEDSGEGEGVDRMKVKLILGKLGSKGEE